MVLVIKKDGSCITFNMANKIDEKNYIKRFSEIPETASIDLKQKGKYPKKDILFIFWVKDKDDAKEKTKEFFSFIKRVFSS